MPGSFTVVPAPPASSPRRRGPRASHAPLRIVRAADNDVLTFKLGRPGDFWLHVAGQSGSHVVVLNPDGLERMPRDTARFAAALAARHSKAKRGGQVAVHATTCAEVRKPRGLPPGKVTLKKYRSLKASPSDSVL